MGNAVGWFEIYVNDMPRAKAFYESTMGVQLQKMEFGEGEMWTFPMEQEGYGAPGALVRMDGFGAGGNSVLVYFSCEDCGATAQKAVQAGGRIQQDKMSIGQYGFIALVVDTEGNLIGLHSGPQ